MDDAGCTFRLFRAIFYVQAVSIIESQPVDALYCPSVYELVISVTDADQR